MINNLLKLTAKSLPDSYFKAEFQQRDPKAPPKVLFSSFFSEIGASFGILIFFIYYFASLSTPITTISPSILS